MPFKAFCRGFAAKAFEDIPTTASRSWPILGHIPALLHPQLGNKGISKQVAKIRAEEIDPEIDLLRLNIPMLNTENDGRVVYVFRPEDAEVIYRNEGRYPFRGDTIKMLKVLRRRRPDIFGGTLGVLLEEGERWKAVRSAVQQDLMRPKSALYYLDDLQDVADDFVQHVRRKTNPETRINEGDLLKDLHMWGFESVSLAALDTRMGLLKANPDEEAQRLIKCSALIIENFPDLIFRSPLWNLLPNMWHSTFRLCEEQFQLAIDLMTAKLRVIEDKIRSKTEMTKEDETEVVDFPVLQKLIMKHPDSPIPTVMALDMVFAGIDTTGNSAGFLLHNLATNPDKQELLREEMNSFGNESPLTPQDVGKMKYFRACFKESQRHTPTVEAAVRILPQEVVIRGYTIPKGTLVFIPWNILSHDPKNFVRPDLYSPERWLNKNSKNSIHPFASLQFGHGPRKCIGQRFAELEILILTYKLLRNFRVEWAGSIRDTPLPTETALTNRPIRPLKFMFTDL